jgi:hypothetical protein
LREAFREACRRHGFQLRRFPACLRLVKGRCEVHVRPGRGAGGLLIEIPIVRLGADRPVPEILASYLEERNKGHKGPGAFAVEPGFIWYRASVDPGESPEKAAGTALAMQETVERIGPKILNMLR